MYLLMYKNNPVLSFSKKDQNGVFLDRENLPFALKNEKDAYDAMRGFCASRIMLMNREYSKEILTSCGIEDQSPLNICLLGRGLSFRDNYWIKEDGSDETWEKVNLYDNPFSREISYTALTGESTSVTIGDGLYTGELTNRGTRTKCLFSQNDNIFLAKAETDKEISAEILSGQLNGILRIRAAAYIKTEVYGKQCSVCRIATSPRREMIPCRDVLQYCGGRMKMGNPYYNLFMAKDPINFVKMQIFDYLTLNTDSNRDNFALEEMDGLVTGLYPLYDHDSCFKGLSEKAVYFVTGLPFDESMTRLRLQYKRQYDEAMEQLMPGLKRMEKEGSYLFDDIGLKNSFDGFMERVEKCLSSDNIKNINSPEKAAIKPLSGTEDLKIIRAHIESDENLDSDDFIGLGK